MMEAMPQNAVIGLDDFSTRLTPAKPADGGPVPAFYPQNRAALAALTGRWFIFRELNFDMSDLLYREASGRPIGYVQDHPSYRPQFGAEESHVRSLSRREVGQVRIGSQAVGDQRSSVDFVCVAECCAAAACTGWSEQHASLPQ